MANNISGITVNATDTDPVLRLFKRYSQGGNYCTYSSRPYMGQTKRTLVWEWNGKSWRVMTTTDITTDPDRRVFLMNAATWNAEWDDNPDAHGAMYLTHDQIVKAVEA